VNEHQDVVLPQIFSDKGFRSLFSKKRIFESKFSAMDRAALYR